jgi:hypothetical protein
MSGRIHSHPLMCLLSKVIVYQLDILSRHDAGPAASQAIILTSCVIRPPFKACLCKVGLLGVHVEFMRSKGQRRSISLTGSSIEDADAPNRGPRRACRGLLYESLLEKMPKLSTVNYVSDVSYVPNYRFE